MDDIEKKLPVSRLYKLYEGQHVAAVVLFACYIEKFSRF